jgi:hypothetical protein
MPSVSPIAAATTQLAAHSTAADSKRKQIPAKRPISSPRSSSQRRDVTRRRLWRQYPQLLLDAVERRGSGRRERELARPRRSDAPLRKTLRPGAAGVRRMSRLRRMTRQSLRPGRRWRASESSPKSGHGADMAAGGKFAGGVRPLAGSGPLSSAVAVVRGRHDGALAGRLWPRRRRTPTSCGTARAHETSPCACAPRLKRDAREHGL